MAITVYAVELNCLPSHPCHIVLPRQNLLGTYGDQDYQEEPGEWPAIFVCLRHGHWFVRSGDNRQRISRALGLDRPILPVWRIGIRCARGQCGRLRMMYTGNALGSSAVQKGLLRWPLEISCDGHHLLKLDEKHIEVIEELAF